jgi:protein involved in ribonucleotide reduction
LKYLNILYISLSGNTTNFVERLTQHLATLDVCVHAINVKATPDPKPLDAPFVSFLPAFLKGGNGVNNGYTEILTGILADYLVYADNYKRCVGIIGSGNRNFNKQFALTAKQYAQRFGFPYLTEFELRGSENDIVRIGQMLLAYAQPTPSAAWPNPEA